MTQVPSSGLTLVHDRTPAKGDSTRGTRQIIQLNLVESQTRDLLKALRNNEQVRLKLGKKPTVQYGNSKRSISLNHGDDPFPSEVFTGAINGKEPMYFSGRLSHTLEVQKAKEDTAKTDGALAALESQLKSYQEQRASNEASLVKGETNNKARDMSRRDLKPSTLNGTRFFGSTPSSPFIPAGRSPVPAPTSAPALSAAAARDKVRLDAMRIPMVHLLALGPMTTEKMAKTLNVPREECERALDKVSREVNGQRELKDKSYKELNVWNFPYQSSGDRQKAVEHAAQVYDRLRVERTDQLWQLLLPKEERDKGKTLSKFNFDKQLAAPKTAPGTEKEKAEVSDRENKVKKPKVTKETLPKKKVNEDIILKPRGIKASTKVIARQPKQESKYKSNERIEDSDEEAELASKPNIKTVLPVTKVKERDLDRLPTKPGLSKTHLHKSRISESSSTSSDNDKARRPVDREMMKSRPRIESNSSKKSPQPRADGLHFKRSPLGSSPPTNFTDADDSSKASTQSSAPSSPPSSGDGTSSQRRVYSPVVAGRSKAQQPSPPKRKAEKSDDEPATKRQHVNGDRLNSLPKGLTSQLQHPTPERRSSGSSTSSPDRTRTNKQDVIAAAKAFTSYYGRYRELHEKLSRLSSKERGDRDIDRLWEMHKRLEEMKADIWKDWDAVGGD